MTDETGVELRAEFEQRWTAAAASLMPKLGAFAGALDPDEQGVLAYLLRELLPEGEETAGYLITGAAGNPSANSPHGGYNNYSTPILPPRGLAPPSAPWPFVGWLGAGPLHIHF